MAGVFIYLKRIRHKGLIQFEPTLKVGAFRMQLKRNVRIKMLKFHSLVVPAAPAIYTILVTFQNNN